MPNTSLPIVLLAGTDKSNALREILAAGEHVVAAILPPVGPKESRLGELPRTIEDMGIPLHRPRRSELLDTLRVLQPIVLLSMGYPFLLRREHLDSALHAINVHPTLLPHYRGPATAWHVLAHGEKETGVTVHLIDEGMDTGPILVQHRIPLSAFDTLASLRRKTDAAEPGAVLEALHELRNGNTQGTPQGEGSAFLEIRTPEDSRIDPAKPLQDLFSFIRACDPDRFPAFFEVEGQRVGIRFFRMHKPDDEHDLL